MESYVASFLLIQDFGKLATEIRSILNECEGGSAIKLAVIYVDLSGVDRLYPAHPVDPHAPATEQNVKTGTIVDQVITHPTEWDWILVSHSVIKVIVLSMRSCTRRYWYLCRGGFQA